MNGVAAARVCASYRNEGHHWWLNEDKFLAEWWPSSAKLVINKQWNEGRHCHDYRQALEMIERVYVKMHNGLSRNSPSGP